MRTLQQLCVEALQVQNACNICGLARTFANVMEELRELILQGAAGGQLRLHPVTVLWVSKLHDMASLGISDTDRFHHSYEFCLHVASHGVPPGTPIEKGGAA